MHLVFLLLSSCSSCSSSLYSLAFQHVSPKTPFHRGGPTSLHPSASSFHQLQQQSSGRRSSDFTTAFVQSTIDMAARTNIRKFRVTPLLVSPGGLSDEDENFTGGDDPQQQRRRKRDILKRTLGIGGSSSSGNGGDDAAVVRLDTANLFRGMPSIDSILGQSSQPPYVDTPATSSSPASPPDEEPRLKQQGRLPDVDFLTPQDELSLNEKYSNVNYQLTDDYSFATDFTSSSTTTSTNNLDNKGLSTEDTKKIIDYTIEEEKLMERRKLNEIRKNEMLQQWEDEGMKKVEERFYEITSGSNDGSGSNDDDDFLEKDGVAREILEDAQSQERQRLKSIQQQNELSQYEKITFQSKMAEALDKFDDATISTMDIDDLYELVLNEIQSSRKNKLGPKSLGVLANSIPLEEGREFIRRQKQEKEFLREVEELASLEGVTSDDDVEKFFRGPGDYNEERMYRSIVRQIIDQRMEEEEEDVAIMEGNNDDDDDEYEMGGITVQDEKEKYKLSAKETVEAYKLFNLWREMQATQDTLETALGMKDDTAYRPNRLEPYFLYEEDSEETRRKEKEQLTKVLKRGLASNDAVEISSNELLMKELLEGGVTKDRAVRLLDKLITKTTVGTIRDSLKELKNTIMEEDEMDRVRNVGEKKKSGQPIDLSGFFRTSDDLLDIESSATAAPVSKPMEGGGRTMPSWIKEEVKVPPAPNTPFFSSSSSFASEKSPVAMPPPPKTAFFQSTGKDETGGESYSPTGGMFGTYEEQKFESLAGRLGARSDEEKEELRRNMEALRQAEEMANAELLKEDFDIAAASAKLGINIDDLNLEDEEDGQIISILGKRPVSEARAQGRPTKAILEFNEKESDEGIIVDAEGRLKRMKIETKVDIADDIFRTKTAGKYQDRETRDKDEAAFRELLKMEEDAETQLDAMGDESLSEDFDIDEFADDILSEMKPRPRVNRREDFMSQEQLQKERKQESIFGDDPFPINEAKGRREISASDTTPAWLRKEQEDYGITVDDDEEEDTFDEAQWEWEREERQKKADAYLKKRGEGISISDVLGREYFGPMDDEEYYKKERVSAFSSFQARKEELLTYEELTVEDINNVIDFKVDPSETGYNPYLSKVQRPFSEYGAIFRLEGVLVDLIGLHAKAWLKVAKTYGYEISSPDEVRRASLYKPEDAVREVFFWTDDIFEWEAIAETHRVAFTEAFNTWLETKSVVTASGDDSVDVGTSQTDNNIRATPSDAEMESMYKLAWSKLANKLNRTPPTGDQVYRGILGQDWEVAVKDIFGWSDDPQEVYEIVVAYDEILQADYKTLLGKYGIDLDKANKQDEESLFGLNIPDVTLKEGVKDWLNTIREVKVSCAVMSHLDSSQLDAVLEATGLAEYFPPERCVSSDSKYSARSEYLGAALRAEQRPEHCVIFENTPISATIAHDVLMKNIAFVDHYAKYELLTADVSFGYVSDLDLMDIVKIFENTREDNEPMLELDVNSGLQKQVRKLKTSFWDE